MSNADWLKGWDAVREYGENRYSIQQSPGFQEVACVKDLKNPEMEPYLDAAAHLIAAAPDLLDACEAHIEALGSLIRDGKDRPEYAEAIYQAQKKMYAAIAKARGVP